MSHYRSALLIVFISGLMGCGGIPSVLKDTGAVPLEECSKNMDISQSDDKGAILTSIALHLASGDHNEWYFLLKEESTRSKYVMTLEPRVFGIPKEGLFGPKSAARSACFVIQPGRYQFAKAYHFVESGANYAYRLKEYDYRGAFHVQAGKVTYIGQVFIEDPVVKGKTGYFQHLSAVSGKVFSTLLLRPQEGVEISRVDESDEDLAWLEQKTHTTRGSVIYAVESDSAR